MSLLHYLFGFSGRINRAKQWAAILVGFVFAIFIMIAFSVMVGFAPIAAIIQKTTTPAAVFATPQVHAFGILLCALYAFLFYISLAISAKRLHDRNKSAWWLLIFLILPLAMNIPALLHLPDQFHYMAAVMKAAQAHLPPPPRPYDPPLVILSRGIASILSLWAFVELYCLRGTVGDNRYGPDPLAGKA